jgi:hypothetical protein
LTAGGDRVSILERDKSGVSRPDPGRNIHDA